MRNNENIQATIANAEMIDTNMLKILIRIDLDSLKRFLRSFQLIKIDNKNPNIVQIEAK